MLKDSRVPGGMRPASGTGRGGLLSGACRLFFCCSEGLVAAYAAVKMGVVEGAASAAWKRLERGAHGGQPCGVMALMQVESAVPAIQP